MDESLGKYVDKTGSKTTYVQITGNEKYIS